MSVLIWVQTVCKVITDNCLRSYQQMTKVTASMESVKTELPPITTTVLFILFDSLRPINNLSVI